MFELLTTLSDNFVLGERGEIFDIGMRNISATKLREKTHSVFERIMWKCFCSQDVLCVFECKSENISILLQGSRTWCGGASPLVNPTANAIYKPPKPTLEVTCQTQSQTLGGRKCWLDGDGNLIKYILTPGTHYSYYYYCTVTEKSNPYTQSTG